jgi:hypothetical protein
MFDMIAASASLVLAATSIPAMAPVAAVPAMVASTAAAAAMAAEVSRQDAPSAPKASPVDAIVEVHLSRGTFVVRHEDGGVEYRPLPITLMRFGLVGDKLTVCDATGAYLQANDTGRCVLSRQSPDIAGKFAVRHVADATYEFQYAGKSVSGPMHSRQPATFHLDGINVGVMLYRLSDAEAVVD